MATLAQDYGVSPVAQSLGVNYSALKRRLADPAGEPRSRDGLVSPQFVEVPVEAWQSCSSPWAIELEDSRGAKLTVRFTSGDSATVLELACGLWGQRA
jgi:hypothetical protein